jgi:hypothetical protein
MSIPAQFVSGKTSQTRLRITTMIPGYATITMIHSIYKGAPAPLIFSHRPAQIATSAARVYPNQREQNFYP